MLSSSVVPSDFCRCLVFWGIVPKHFDPPVRLKNSVCIFLLCKGDVQSVDETKPSWTSCCWVIKMLFSLPFSPLPSSHIPCLTDNVYCPCNRSLSSISNRHLKVGLWACSEAPVTECESELCLLEVTNKKIFFVWIFVSLFPSSRCGHLNQQCVCDRKRLPGSYMQHHNRQKWYFPSRGDVVFFCITWWHLVRCSALAEHGPWFCCQWFNSHQPQPCGQELLPPLGAWCGCGGLWLLLLWSCHLGATAQWELA